MAEIFKSTLFNLETGDALVIQETAEPTVVLSLVLSNNHYGTVPVSVWLTRGALTVHLRRDVRIDAGDSLDVLRGTKVALLAGDTVTVQCPIDGAVSGVLSTFKDE